MKSNDATNFSWKINTGIEAQELQSTIINYDNNSGETGAIQADNSLHAEQVFYFAQLTSNITNRLSGELSASINFNQYKYIRSLPVALNSFTRNLEPQLMPRAGISYSILPSLVWRIIASKGYSPPTIAEILPSDNLINTNLQPEQGWNYETGFRFRDNKDVIWFDVAAFTYSLQDAIVRRVHPDDTEFFINAGGTLQNGFESQITIQLLKKEKGFIRNLKISNAFTYSDLTFSDYVNDETDYSGNKLTGIPQQVVVTSLAARFTSGFYITVAHNYTSAIPLNDVNTVDADAYHLVQGKIGWMSSFKKTTIELFAGADNLLDEKYSLGNDLNAVGGRYFNAAPLRSFFGGVNVFLR